MVHIFFWLKGGIYTITYIDADGFTLSCEMEDAWFEWDDYKYCDKFRSLKEIRKEKLEKIIKIKNI